MTSHSLLLLVFRSLFVGLVLAGCILLSGCCCPEKEKGEFDGTWRCLIETKKELDLHIGVIPYKKQEPVWLVIEGNNLDMRDAPEGSSVVTMTLEPKGQDGPRHFVAAKSGPVPDWASDLGEEEVAFQFELSPDSSSLTVSELKDVDWSRPEAAKPLHPMSCTLQ